MAKEKTIKEESNFPTYQITKINGIDIRDIRDQHCKSSAKSGQLKL